MKHDYQAMLAALEPGEVPSESDTTDELLDQIIAALGTRTLDLIAHRLEANRYHYSVTSTPGHLVLYPRKVAVCALWQRLRRNRG